MNLLGLVARLTDNPGIDRKINRAFDRMPGGKFKGVPRGGAVPLRYRGSESGPCVELRFCPLGASNDGESYRLRGLVLDGEHKGHEIIISGAVCGGEADITFGTMIHEGEIPELPRYHWWWGG